MLVGAPLIIVGASAIVLYSMALNIRVRNIESSFAEVKSKQENLNQNLSEELFKDHLKVVENIALNNKIKEIETELETLRTSKDNKLLSSINNVYNAYQDFQKKLTRNTQVKLATNTVIADVNTWGTLLMTQQFDALESSISAQVKILDDDYTKYLATLSPPTPVAGGGYNYQTVKTERGTFGMYLIKISKSSVSVKTIAAIDSDCKNDCATKSLEQYVKDNNAFAGIAGSYSCPADYPQCADKKWSFDFALYDSNNEQWLNKGARSWGETGMFTFTGSSSKFYEKSSSYGGDGVTAAISNYPSLLSGGNVVVNSDSIDSYQNTKGLRGVLGTDDKNIYLAYVSNASVIDAAYAIKAAGATNALNLDGGGSSAMYANGGYIVGPGRQLPNAVLLIK